MWRRVQSYRRKLSSYREWVKMAGRSRGRAVAPLSKKAAASKRTQIKEARAALKAKGASGVRVK